MSKLTQQLGFLLCLSPFYQVESMIPVFHYKLSSISVIFSSGKFNLSFKIKFILSFTNLGTIAAWYELIFLEINIPFLSIISLRSNINFEVELSRLEIEVLLKEICIIFIQKIKINERKKKKSRLVAAEHTETSSRASKVTVTRLFFCLRTGAYHRPRGRFCVRPWRGT